MIQERIDERTDENVQEARSSGWTDVDSTKEVFLMPMRQTKYQWGIISMHEGRYRLLDIWKIFISDGIVTKLKSTFMTGNNVCWEKERRRWCNYTLKTS